MPGAGESNEMLSEVSGLREGLTGEQDTNTVLPKV